MSTPSLLADGAGTHGQRCEYSFPNYAHSYISQRLRDNLESYLEWMFTESSHAGSGGSRNSIADYAFQNWLVISALDSDPPLDAIES